MVPKIGDFGLSIRLYEKNQRRYTICGTPNYIAPEILYKVKGYNYSCDVWSFGVLLYIMTFNEVPFKQNEKKLENSIKDVDFKFPNVNVPLTLKNLI